jgi:hypothetical protein
MVFAVSMAVKFVPIFPTRDNQDGRRLTGVKEKKSASSATNGRRPEIAKGDKLMRVLQRLAGCGKTPISGEICNPHYAESGWKGALKRT